MNQPAPVRDSGKSRSSPWLATTAWGLGWAAMFWLDSHVDIANLALLLVLISAVASLWLTAWSAGLTGAASVMAFNWSFVPPRGTFTIDLRQHALLLVAMLVVNTIIAALMAAQRRQARRAEWHASREAQLRAWSETLRDAVDPLAQAGALQQALVDLAGVPVALLLLEDSVPDANDEAATLRVGEADADQLAGLWHCVRQGQAMGPGTGRHEEQPDGYLPLRGRGISLGAAVLRGRATRRSDPDLQAHEQAMCDQMGVALQRAFVVREERRAREQAQTQGMRNVLLAAISHDYRTPLATIMSAASSLDEQADRLGADQRRQLAVRIYEEAARLSRLTDNTLQLARLDAPGVTLRRDWESAEEIVGAALRRARRSEPGRRVRARLEPELPLLWCDAILIAQLLDNLVDNALKYSPAEAPVEILVRTQADNVVLAVRDRGPGIQPAWREQVFEAFQRGAEALPGQHGETAVLSARPGAGVGLAVCRAIARAHGGDLRLRSRGHGGSSFECVLPLRRPPEPPVREASAEAHPRPSAPMNPAS